MRQKGKPINWSEAEKQKFRKLFHEKTYSELEMIFDCGDTSIRKLARALELGPKRAKDYNFNARDQARDHAASAKQERLILIISRNLERKK